MLTFSQKYRLKLRTFPRKKFENYPKLDIVEIYTSNTGHELRKTGRVYLGLCPFHEENHPSFAVYEDTNSFYCFGCGQHGTAWQLKQQLEKL